MGLIQITRFFFSNHFADGLFQHAPLLEQIVYGLVFIIVHRALAEEGEPGLNTFHAGAGCQVAEQYQVEGNRSGQDGITAKEVDLDLHRISHPAEDIDIVPGFLVVAAWRIIVDANLVIEIAIELRILLRFENLFDDRQFADFLGLEVFRLVQNFSVAITQNIG